MVSATRNMGTVRAAAIVAGLALAFLVPTAYQRQSGSPYLPLRDTGGLTVHASDSQTSPSASPASSTVTGEVEGFVLTLTLDRTEFMVGESVEATLTLRYTGPGTVLLESSPQELFTVVVHDGLGNILGLLPRPKDLLEAPSGPVLLAQGQSISRTMSWPGTIQDPLGRVIELGVGLYLLQGQVEVFPEQSLVLTTEMLQVQIADDPSLWSYSIARVPA